MSPKFIGEDKHPSYSPRVRRCLSTKASPQGILWVGVSLYKARHAGGEAAGHEYLAVPWPPQGSVDLSGYFWVKDMMVSPCLGFYQCFPLVHPCVVYVVTAGGCLLVWGLFRAIDGNQWLS